MNFNQFLCSIFTLVIFHIFLTLSLIHIFSIIIFGIRATALIVINLKLTIFFDISIFLKNLYLRKLWFFKALLIKLWLIIWVTLDLYLVWWLIIMLLVKIAAAGILFHVLMDNLVTTELVFKFSMIILYLHLHQSLLFSLSL